MLKQQLLLVGKISGVFGVKGWVKVFSFTEPRENILTYSPWILKKAQDTQRLELLDGVLQSKTIVACLSGVSDRELAAALNGYQIFIDSSLLPEPEANEYYWRDLIGLTVENLQGISLGEVDYLFETGANDVLIVKSERERLIPFVQGQYIKQIDLEAGKMIVDWDADF